MNGPRERLRGVICWTNVSGYMTACWRALAALGSVDFTVIVFETNRSHGMIAFDDAALLAGIPHRVLTLAQRSDYDLILSHVLDGGRRPDVVVVPGWLYKAYLRLLREPKLAGTRFVMTMDTPRRDTLRQRLGRFRLAPVRASLSRVLVAGERSWQLAKLLGFGEEQIRKGMYGVDYAALSAAYDRRANQPGGWPRRFMFAGRYVEEKGIDVLVDAYRQYRGMPRGNGASGAGQPWPLTCCGSGPLAHLLNDQPGVTNLGFVQPQRQYEIMSEHGVLLMASRYDPWPLIIVEAASSGMPVVHTEACGSAVECVRNYYSGRGVATGNARELALAMKWCEDHHSLLPEMGRRALPLAAPHSAQAWAERWVSIFDELR